MRYSEIVETTGDAEKQRIDAQKKQAKQNHFRIDLM